MKNKKRIISLLIIGALAIAMFAGCTNDNQSEQPEAEQTPAAEASPTPDPTPESTPEPAFDFNSNREIIVVSREDGSGTRGAFVELTGVQVSDGDTTTDMTSPEAVIGNGTNAIMTNVAGDTFAIGYISTGSVNDTIKTVKIDGVEPTPANILAGSYGIARPFIIVTGNELTPVAQDFVNFIMSREGQAVIADSFVPVDSNAPEFESNGAGGTVVVGGSTSVTPIMEKLREAYLEINSGAQIEVHGTGSGAGITGAIDGVVDIGMSSRDIRDAEREDLYEVITIAMDGIAIIVNNDNPIDNLTVEQIRAIFTGETTRWSEVIG